MWKNLKPKGFRVSKDFVLQTVLFADDQILIMDNVDDLQSHVPKCNAILERYRMIVCTVKKKVIAICRDERKSGNKWGFTRTSLTL